MTQFVDFFGQLGNSFLLVLTDHAQFGNDIRQLFDVLIFDHQVDGVLTKALYDGCNHVCLQVLSGVG